MLKCSKCQTWKDNGEFHQGARKCKKCVHEYYIRYRERIIQHQTLYNAAHRELKQDSIIFKIDSILN